MQWTVISTPSRKDASGLLDSLLRPHVCCPLTSVYTCDFHSWADTGSESQDELHLGEAAFPPAFALHSGHMY